MSDAIGEKQLKQLEERGISFYICSKNLRELPHSHKCYELIYVMRGKGELHFDGHAQALEEYEYVAMAAGIEHRVNALTSNTVLCSIYISVEEMDKFLSFFERDARNYVALAAEPLTVSGDFNVRLKVEEIYSRILKYGDEDNVLCRLFAIEILSGIFRRMHRKIRSDEIPRAMIDAIYEMRKMENLQEGVPAMERITNYSRSQLCRLIRRYYDRTPNEYVTDLRMNFAYNLIRYSNMDFETIAESVGYSSISYFYKKFREYYSATPSEIRRKEGYFLGKSEN